MILSNRREAGLLAIVDYGMGNLRSVEKGLAHAGYQAVITREPGRIAEAAGIVLPGVGAFADAMEALDSTGCGGALADAVARGRPVLGICLGMQLLFAASEEGALPGVRGGPSLVPGMGLIPGVVRRLPAGLKVPHMGWNRLRWVADHPLWEGIPGGSSFYFVHSYAVHPASPGTGIVLATCRYGADFPAAVVRENVIGVQFHPEKSGRLGLRMLANFGRLVEGMS